MSDCICLYIAHNDVIAVMVLNNNHNEVISVRY